MKAVSMHAGVFAKTYFFNVLYMQPRVPGCKSGKSAADEDLFEMQTPMNTLLSIEHIRAKIATVRNIAGVKRVVLFGSHARGTNDARSDVDLMIVMDTNKKFIDRGSDFDEIHDTFPGTPVELLVYTPEELRNMADRPFIRQVLGEGIDLL